MKVELLYFEGCPNWREAEDRLRQALRQLGLPESALTLQGLQTPEDAERLSFRGSPTILVNGVDPFADPAAPVGLACRIYQTPTGGAGTPTLSQLTEVLADAMSSVCR